MRVVELRDVDEARQWVRQGLWLQRLEAVTPAGVSAALRWALAVSATGDPYARKTVALPQADRQSAAAGIHFRRSSSASKPGI